jgi:outer membrane protein
VSKLIKVIFAVLALSVSTLGWAAGKIAVVDVQGAILQTDVAQKRLGEVRDKADYKKNKAEADRLKSEGEALFKTFKKDEAVMSLEQKSASEKKLSGIQDDFRIVVEKMQQAEQSVARELLQDMAPKAQEALRDIIKAESIGLLLQGNAVIHAEDSYIVTTKVTDKLNQLNTK